MKKQTRKKSRRLKSKRRVVKERLGKLLSNLILCNPENACEECGKIWRVFNAL